MNARQEQALRSAITKIHGADFDLEAAGNEVQIKLYTTIDVAIETADCYLAAGRHLDKTITLHEVNGRWLRAEYDRNSGNYIGAGRSGRYSARRVEALASDVHTYASASAAARANII
jgi:hypothetical protein